MDYAITKFLVGPMFAVMFSFPAATVTMPITLVDAPIPEILATSTVKELPTIDEEIKRLAIKYNQSETLARSIMKCESQMYGGAVNKNYRWEWNAELATTTRVHWSSDWGPWQVNDFYHEKTALAMGLNIYDPLDNLEYGFWLLANEGTRHWKASAYCWKPLNP